VSPLWTRIAIAAAVIVATALLAKAIDMRISRKQLDPTTATRYRILRRAIFTSIVVIGILSALLVIPQVRAVAGGILASGAVLGLVLGFAAQRTIGNFIAGILIAFTQPIRLGDEVEVEGGRGIVEEIGLTYTWVRLANSDRLVVPNERLVSETVRNSTIRSAHRLAEVSVRVPLNADVRGLVEALQEDADDAFLADLGDDATIVLRRWVELGRPLEQAESNLRLAVHDRLRQLGVVQVSPVPS